MDDIVDRIAHTLTGYVAASCCFETGGYEPKPHCLCREAARAVLAAVEPRIRAEHDAEIARLREALRAALAAYVEHDDTQAAAKMADIIEAALATAEKGRGDA